MRDTVHVDPVDHDQVVESPPDRTMPSRDKTVVLVIEDEPLIMMDAMQCLEDAGVETVDAYDVEHALVRLGAHPDIGAVFTDVDMPGRFDGVELARMVNERRPDVVVIVTSGAVEVHTSDLPQNGRLASKPYRGEHVAKLIEELVG